MNRTKDIIHKVVVPLAEVQAKIPRNGGGDPCFLRLGTEPECDDQPYEENVLSVFTPAQITAIVNRWLYQAEYQQVVHRKRAEEQRRLEAPVKTAFKQLYPNTPFIRATEQQIEAAVKAAAAREIGEPDGTTKME